MVSGSSGPILSSHVLHKEQVTNNPQISSRLESLPSELRIEILSQLDLEGLKAMVHSSPSFHLDYLHSRKLLLCKCLEVTLGSVTVDACAFYRAAELSEQRTVKTVTQFLNFYQEQRSLAKYSILSEKFTEHEILRLVIFQSSIIRPLIRHYASYTAANLAHETEKMQKHEPLSRTEQIRLLRALYRFHLCCSLFGNGDNELVRPRYRPQSLDILKALCIFEPWEVEEIACLHTFSTDKYDQIFRDIRWDVHEENPKFDDQRPPTPEGPFDPVNSYISLVDALSETTQSQRRREQSSNRDQKQERRDPLPFTGDSQRDPPLAWTLIWGGTYSNLYGDYVQDAIRRWGYIMWDETRLQLGGGKELLARQWKEGWAGHDPRDYML